MSASKPICIVQASGKTSLVNVIGNGQVRFYLLVLITRVSWSVTSVGRRPQWSEDVVPTVAFHFRKVRKGNVTMKIWDLAGAWLRFDICAVLLKSDSLYFAVHALQGSHGMFLVGPKRVCILRSII